MHLTAAMERFILHWGEMSTRWEVNRAVVQIHALLYLSPKPLSAEEIVDTLVLARSNVSSSLKELQRFGLITITHVVVGDKRGYFEAIKDVREVFNLAVERRRSGAVKRQLVELSMLKLSALVANLLSGFQTIPRKYAEHIDTHTMSPCVTIRG